MKIKKILKGVGKGIFSMIKDILPISNPDLFKLDNERLKSETSDKIQELQAEIITRLVSSAGGTILIILYLLDKLLGLGFFS